MARYATGKYAKAISDRSGLEYRYKIIKRPLRNANFPKSPSKSGMEEGRELVIDGSRTKYDKPHYILDLDTRLIFNYGVIINLGKVIKSLDFLKW